MSRASNQEAFAVPDRSAPATTSGASRLDAATTYAPRDHARTQFRDYLAQLIGVVEQHPEPGMARDESLWRLAELVDELSRDPLSPRRVQSRWLRLVPLLSEVRPDIPIPALTDLLHRALGTA
ncbi:hypothetical protein SAMN05421805_105190 [Saccharopolyspora antimicrobica]|uniref:Uncharacterized protein n=1 Tax=Saccharopolyspora antimicrobica TaxID=455193 RepID=A0A1I5A035_9PSEU|nr:hypothetical protein [Saccharopolyspora antimicrobica]RKT83325.1 hypothetical protein ATL45_1606 [Saccharopolyspora antimicrobica]SFN55835.1 hypothetical protein SAMN05421805_105190 [Saccharopolyspora antimicrobica]